MGAYASLEHNAVVKMGAGGSAVGTTNGTGVDTKDFSEALVILATGVALATGTLDVKIQDSADNSTFADVSGAAFAQLTASDDQVIKIARLKLDGNLFRRYIRAVGTVGTATVDYTVTFVLSGNQYKPQTANAIAFTV